MSQPSGRRALGSTPRRSLAMSLGTAAAAVSWHRERRRELARPAQHVPAHSTTLHTISEQEENNGVKAHNQHKENDNELDIMNVKRHFESIDPHFN